LGRKKKGKKDPFARFLIGAVDRCETRLKREKGGPTGYDSHPGWGGKREKGKTTQRRRRDYKRCGTKRKEVTRRGKGKPLS